jgi:thiamine pyrophosphate-dependent acetolactate synthase large subunit-like protein
MSKKVAQVIVDTLVSAGVKHCYGIVGDANRNRAPVILIASQIVRRELGFDFIQEVEGADVFEMIEENFPKL